MISAIIAAGGKGVRMGAEKNKVYLDLCGKEIIARTVEVFEACDSVDEIIVVTGETDIDNFKSLIKKYNFKKVVNVVCGGKTRVESVYNGLLFAQGDIVLIHDGARALITKAEINSVIDDCKMYGASALGVKCNDTLKISDKGFVGGTLDRESVYRIQTPQAFFRDDIINAHKSAKNKAVTDDCALAEQIGIKIKITEGSVENIKLTTPVDMRLAENILKQRTEN